MHGVLAPGSEGNICNMWPHFKETPQHVATHCNTLQHSATHWIALQHISKVQIYGITTTATVPRIHAQWLQHRRNSLQWCELLQQLHITVTTCTCTRTRTHMHAHAHVHTHTHTNTQIHIPEQSNITPDTRAATATQSTTTHTYQ